MMWEREWATLEMRCVAHVIAEDNVSPVSTALKLCWVSREGMESIPFYCMSYVVRRQE